MNIYKLVENKKIRFEITDEQLQKLDVELQKQFDRVTTLVSADTQSIVLRMGLIAYKIAMMLTILRQNVKTPPKEVIFCTDQDFETAIQMMKTYLDHSMIVYKELPKKSNNQLQQQAQKMYTWLPDKFSRKELVPRIGELNISQRTFDSYLKTFVQKGLLKKDKHGEYGKTNP